MQLTVNLETAGVGVKKGAEVARDSYRELVKSQKEWFNGVEVGLGAMKGQLQSLITAYGAQVEGQTRNLMNEWTKAVTECLRTYENQVSQLQGDLDELQTAVSRLRQG